MCEVYEPVGAVYMPYMWQKASPTYVYAFKGESHQKLEVYKKRGGEMGSAIHYIIYLMYWTWQPDLLMILSTSLNQLYISMQVA